LNDLRTEEEQIAAIKAWWTSNGTQLLAGVLVIALGYFGYQGWQNNKAEEAIAAGDIPTIAGSGRFEFASSRFRYLS